MMQPVRTAAVVLAMAPASLSGAGAAAGGPGTPQGIYLPYENVGPGAGSAARIPKLRLSFGREAFPVVMDTGSTGIVVSADRIPGIDTLPSRPGRLTYSSSGRIMIGRWVTTPVRILGRDRQGADVRPLPVLAVDRIACTPHARTCQPDERPRGVAMMGVGFGREDDGQRDSTPDTNPFLNLVPGQGGGSLRRGYVVTRAGVSLGLARADADRSFRLLKLQPRAGLPGEWNGVPVCIAVEGRDPPQCGTGLIDTGVEAMFLTLPRADGSDRLDGADDLPKGTRLSFRFTDDPVGAAAARYEVTVGDAASPTAPRTIHLNTTRPAPFVNTGVRFLNGFDILYDADAGSFGFRPRTDPVEGEAPGVANPGR